MSGLLESEDGPWASDTVTNLYNNGRLRSGLILVQPTGTWTNGFTYDSAHRLSNVVISAGTFSYAYKGPGNLVTNLALPNSAKITNTYDNVARVTGTYLVNSGGTVLNKHEYLYNTGNQRIRHTRTDGSYYTNTYDNIGQLKVSDSTVNTEDRGYLYDAAWNLNQRTNNGVATTFNVNVKNELTNTTPISSFTYDGNGNLTAESGLRSFTYDAENQLTSVAFGTSYKTDFVYDGLGRRRKLIEYAWTNSAWQVSSEIRYVYDGMRVIQERNSGNTPTVSYTRGSDLGGSLEGAGGIGGLLARSHGYSAGSWGTHNYYHTDGGGNITMLVDGSAVTVASYRYDPFGNTISSSGGLASTNVYRFSSKEIHGNSGLYYYGYRYYDPNLQRWPNRDPLGDDGSLAYEAIAIAPRFEPRSRREAVASIEAISDALTAFTRVNLNLYGAVGNNPVDNVDPYGLDWLDCMSKCIKKNDPFNKLVNPNLAKGALIGLGGTVPYSCVRPIFGPKGGTPLTTIPSMAQTGLRAAGLRPGGILRAVGRFFSPVFVGYGLGMVGIEAACAKQCASDSKSFDW